MPRFDARAVAVVTGLYALVAAVVLVPALLWPEVAGIPWPDDPAQDAGLGAACGVCLAILAWPLLRVGPGRRLAADLAATLHGLPAWGGPVLSLSAGIAEEILFRGALFTLGARLAGDLPALAATSLLFGAAHGLFSRRLAAWGVFAAATGLALGGLRLATGAVLAPVVAHVVVDLINIPVVTRGRWTDAG